MQEKTKSMLLELADFLDRLPEHRFDFGEWVGDDWQGNPNLSCGTTACAAGWSTTLPSFQKYGLRLTTYDSVAPATVKDDYDYGIQAMANVLEISWEDAATLFMPLYHGELLAPPGNATPKEVAGHIRNWIAVESSVSLTS